jgi:hypothetical protein
MESIVVKIVNKTSPSQIQEARGELVGAGYVIKYEGDAEFLGVDANKIGGGEDAFENAYILLGGRVESER